MLRWVTRWTREGWDLKTHEHMMTHETFRLFGRVFEAIKRWYLSDPWVLQPDGTYLPMQLHERRPAKGGAEEEGDEGKHPGFFSNKNSSINEARHDQTNGLADSIGGNGISDALRARLLVVKDLMVRCGFKGLMKGCQTCLPDDVFGNMGTLLTVRVSPCIYTVEPEARGGTGAS